MLLIICLAVTIMRIWFYGLKKRNPPGGKKPYPPPPPRRKSPSLDLSSNQATLRHNTPKTNMALKVRNYDEDLLRKGVRSVNMTSFLKKKN